MSADSFEPTSGVPLSTSRPADDEFEVTFHRLWPVAVATARRLVSEQSAAEDVASEAFARALSRWSRVRRLDHRDAWILRVTINLALDELRRRRPDGGVATELSAVDIDIGASAGRHRPDDLDHRRDNDDDRRACAPRRRTDRGLRRWRGGRDRRRRCPNRRDAPGDQRTSARWRRRHAPPQRRWALVVRRARQRDLLAHDHEDPRWRADGAILAYEEHPCVAWSSGRHEIPTGVALMAW